MVYISQRIFEKNQCEFAMHWQTQNTEGDLQMYNFDIPAVARAGSDSVKWNAVSGDVLPMWVADMDIQCPPPVLEAIQKRAVYPYFGYPYTQDELKKHIVAHYEKLYGAKVDPEWIVWIPSVIPGVVTAMQMTGGEFMYSVPMYDHIRRLDAEAKMPVTEVPLKRDEHGRYAMDIDALEKAVTPKVKSLILCNPHNPVGRVYTREELEELWAFCKKHDLLVISDEIHCEFDFEKRHIPFFSLNAEAAQHSVTASSAGKICNIPGLPMGFVIIPNDELRAKFVSQQDGLQPSGNVVTIAAYEKAYDGSCDEWKNELRSYLIENRDFAELRFNVIPEIKTPHNEGTYLLWLDCSGLGVENPSEFFLEKAHVKVSDGAIYGEPQCVRFNYGCTHAQLEMAIDRMEKAISDLRKAK